MIKSITIECKECKNVETFERKDCSIIVETEDNDVIVHSTCSNCKKENETSIYD
jgi:hypothetical protein